MPEPLPGAPRLICRSARDADEHAQNLSAWNQTYDQLSPGGFEGCLRELWLTHTQVFLESTNRKLRQSCRAWSGALWFGIPRTPAGGARMDSHEIPPHAIAVRQGGRDFELRTPEDFDIYGIVVETAELARYLAEVEQRELHSVLAARELLCLPAAAHQRLCAQLARTLSAAPRSLAGADPATAARELQDRVLGALVSVLMLPLDEAAPPSLTRAHRLRTVQRIREYVLAHPDEPLSVPQLCRQFHMSRRALQYCFEDVVGLAPLVYLRTLRLNGVRRALRTGAAPQVSAAANAWGFHHLSQFAQDYRRLFGERPSQARAAAGG